MRRSKLLALLPFVALSVAGCKSAPAETARLGPIEADVWRETDGSGNMVRCYLIGKDSNAPVRVCGEGNTTPHNEGYLITAVEPVAGKFTSEIGKPLDPGAYMLLPLGSSKVEAWSLGRIGGFQWVAKGQAMLMTETKGAVTHVREIQPSHHFDKTWDVPLSKSEGFIMVANPDDTAVLLVQKLGGELMVLVHQPAGDSYIETLDVPNGTELGTKKFWRRGVDARQNNGVWTVDSMVTANVDWKAESPTFEGAPLGPWEDPEVRKKKKVKPPSPAP